MSEGGEDRAPGWYADHSGQRRWWDGATWTEWVDATPDQAEETPAEPAIVPGEALAVEALAAWPERRQSEGSLSLAAKLLLFGLPSLVLAGAVAVVIVALTTAERWTAIDVPAHAETFHREQYWTGAYNVIDNRINPCYVGQDWNECRNLMVNEYNRECAQRLITPSGKKVCDAYGAEIDRMAGVGEYGWTVTSLGSFGYLRSEKEMDSREVGNGDYRPAVTHEATCYLGFLGECPN